MLAWTMFAQRREMLRRAVAGMRVETVHRMNV